MPRAQRVTLFLDCPFYAWREERRQEKAISRMFRPARRPVIEVAFTFNDGPSALADYGQNIVLKHTEGVKS